MANDRHRSVVSGLLLGMFLTAVYFAGAAFGWAAAPGVVSATVMLVVVGIIEDRRRR